MSGTWVVDGNWVLGPGTTAIMVREHGTGRQVHPDLGFLLHRDRPDVPAFWDCVAGMGATEDAALERAITIWSQTTGAAALELLTQRGQFAQHLGAEDPQGFRGWHTIHAPLLGWGVGNRAAELQEWGLNHPLLPALRDSIAPALDRKELNGLKLFLGSAGGKRFAEVRVNGVNAPDATAALTALDWPTFDDFGTLRTYAILVYQEPVAAQSGAL